MRTFCFLAISSIWAIGTTLTTSACSVDMNGTGPAPDGTTTLDGTIPDASPDEATTSGEEDVGDVVPPDGLDANADALSQADAGENGADGGKADAALDASTCNVANCGGACCGDKCIARSCAGCSEGAVFCPYSTTAASSNGQCVMSCESCAPGGGAVLSVTCISCAPGSPLRTCAATAAACPIGLAAGACSCAADAGACTGP